MTDQTPDDLTDVERRLRAALADEAASIEPDPDGLRHIEEKLMAPDPSRTRWYVLGGVAAVVILVIGLAVGLTGGDDDPEVTTDDPTTTTTEAPTSSSTATTVEESPFAPTTDPSLVVFPAIDSSQRFDDPRAVAFAFATEYAGFTDPVLSDFREGDSRSGEFEVTRNGSGPVTTILVRQLDDDTWGVIGAVHDGITPEKPEPGDVITSPVEVAGLGFAFEGTINVDVREQGRTASIGEGFVTAGGTPPGDIYQGEIAFSEPSTDTGAIMYREFSAEDGTTSWVSITLIRFVPAAGEGCGGTDEPAADEVLVFYGCDDAAFVGVARPGDGTAGVLQRALTLLVEGPVAVDEVRSRDLITVFPVDGVELLGVTVADGVATIDLSGTLAQRVEGGDDADEFRVAIGQLGETATQFSTVEEVRVLLDGSCDAFAAWADLDGCVL